MIQVLLCPGYVTSKNDGDEHYITAGQLKKLYRLDPNKHIISKHRGIPLYPLYHGDYEEAIERLEL